eukprot:TRINITY_DN89307_c0_g1_i1.p1 TRINITY_DN89307_c0_g1~~TRINITY_DN89307_c0_g1_i1.p1  ORF type:complete len:540 (-),score=108.31 TRINITY_DN89307_c0_g1_i1:24-1643(-)
MSEYSAALDTAEQLNRDAGEAAEEAKRAAADRRLHVELAKQRELENEASKPRDQSKETASSSAVAGGAGAVQEPGATAASEVFSNATAKAQAASRSVWKKKKPKEDIFHDFGKEHDDAPIQEVKDANGLVAHRLNYKRYWQSDKDLKRWGESLDHHTRYDKLIFQVRTRWHEDLQGDRLDLKIKHNALIRSRQENRIKPASSASVALQLRELQNMILPKDKKKKGALSKSDMGFLKGFQGGGSAAVDDQASEDPLGDTLGFKTQVDDLNVLSPARSESPPSSPGRMSRRRPSGESDRPPDLMPSESAPALGSKLHQVSKQTATVIPGMPKTLALLLFRNADRLHAGETCFVKVWPPPGGLKELLAIAGEACKPVIAPAYALYDTELKKIKTLNEVVPGGIYLLKGMEGFDPPKLFFNHDTAKVPSLRHLTHNRNTVAAELDTLGQFSQLPSPASSMSQILSRGQERQPTVDSPPWGSKGALRVAPRPRHWEVDEYLGHKLSWGGLGMPHRHQLYEDWVPVLQSPFNHVRQIDRSASGTL